MRIGQQVSSKRKFCIWIISTLAAMFLFTTPVGWWMLESSPRRKEMFPGIRKYRHGSRPCRASSRALPGGCSCQASPCARGGLQGPEGECRGAEEPPRAAQREALLFRQAGLELSPSQPQVCVRAKEGNPCQGGLTGAAPPTPGGQCGH